MIFKIYRNPVHFHLEFPSFFHPVRETRNAVNSHSHSFSVVMCRTAKYSRCFNPSIPRPLLPYRESEIPSFFHPVCETSNAVYSHSHSFSVVMCRNAKYSTCFNPSIPHPLLSYRECEINSFYHPLRETSHAVYSHSHSFSVV